MPEMLHVLEKKRFCKKFRLSLFREKNPNILQNKKFKNFSKNAKQRNVKVLLGVKCENFAKKIPREIINYLR